MRLDEVPTPALVVDRRVLERNIAAMAGRAGAAGLELVPHIKTHKSADITRLQLAAGAAGACVATPAEAELAVEAGAPLVLVAHPPAAPDRLARVVALAGRARIRVALDSEAVAEALDAAARDAGAALEWLWELDCGVGRCGTPPGEDTAERVAALAARTAHARFAGLLTFGGHSYRARDIHEIAAAAEDERSAVADTAAALEARGVPVPVRSVGSTPTAHVHRHPTGVTELRPGNYVYNDATQVALEVARPEDCALSVLATVVSHPTADRIILDAGSKALGADRLTERAPGFGLVADRLELRVERLYEEHAIVTSHFPIDLPVGARVCVVPNHACTAANLHARMLVTADGAHAEPWTISARLDGMEHDCHASTS